MLGFQYLLVLGAIAMFVVAATIVVHDLRAGMQCHRSDVIGSVAVTKPNGLPWRTGLAVVALAWTPLMVALSLVVVRGRIFLGSM